MGYQDRIKSITAARATAAKPAADTTGSCNRRSRRKSTALPAILTFPNMRLAVPCTVTDMSGSGAKVAIGDSSESTVGDVDDLPNRLTLILRADHMQVDCDVVWRRAGRLGLRFLGPPRATPRPPKS